MNDCCNAGRWSVRRADFRAHLGLLLLSVCPLSAFAQWTAIPHAAVDAEHNSNVFDLSSSGPLPLGNHGPTLADTSVEGRAGVDASYLLGLQKFFFIGEYRRFEYDHFSFLSHNEATLDGGLNWKIARLLDGKIEYSHDQRMVQFMDLADTTQLILETENKGTVSANLALTPEWRLENLLSERTLNSPRINIPGLSLREESIREGIRYLGVANLSAGIDAEYLQGKYRDDPTALTPKYHQSSIGLAANYAVSGLTNFNGNLGFTRRADATNAGVSALTGAIGYQRNLTGKTAVTVNLNRAVNSYISTAGSEIDTSAAVGLKWQATYRLLAKAGYTWTNSKFPQGAFAGGTTDRVDHLQLVNAEIDYVFLRWLTLRAYGHYQTRSSNQQLFNFNASVVGVEIVAKPQPRN